MASTKGTLVLMGSGELTATMVEVHKELLSARGPRPKAVFLDTPAGFQLNVDQISRNAVSYFRRHVGQQLAVASFHSRQTTDNYEAERAFRMLREADYILIGPGSPTYAVRQLEPTTVPDAFEQVVRKGGCLVFASAAALTAGAFTLPVWAWTCSPVSASAGWSSRTGTTPKAAPTIRDFVSWGRRASRTCNHCCPTT